MIEKARTCDYKNWTNTEQEIIVAYFPENGRALKHKIVAPDPIDSLPNIGVDVPAGRMCAGVGALPRDLGAMHTAQNTRLDDPVPAGSDTEDIHEAYRIAVEILKGSLPKGEVPIPDAKCLEASKSQLRASNIPRNIVAQCAMIIPNYRLGQRVGRRALGLVSFCRSLCSLPAGAGKKRQM